VQARGAQPVDDGVAVAIGRESTVAADADDLRAGLRGERAERLAEGACECRVEVPIGDAADVVLAEDGRIQLRIST
jgi:hypothetical protein